MRFAVLAISTLVACGPIDEAAQGGAAAEGGADVSDALERAQDSVTRKVIDMEGVTGTALGLCDGEPCIKVYVERNSPALRSRLPRTQNGYPVVVEVTGRFRRP